MLIKLKNKTQWHRWFAWYPIRIEGKLIWLRFVERQVGYYENWGGGYTWKNYRI